MRIIQIESTRTRGKHVFDNRGTVVSLLNKLFWGVCACFENSDEVEQVQWEHGSYIGYVQFEDVGYCLYVRQEEGTQSFANVRISLWCSERGLVAEEVQSFFFSEELRDQTVEIAELAMRLKRACTGAFVSRKMEGGSDGFREVCQHLGELDFVERGSFDLRDGGWVYCCQILNSEPLELRYRMESGVYCSFFVKSPTYTPMFRVTSVFMPIFSRVIQKEKLKAICELSCFIRTVYQEPTSRLRPLLFERFSF